MKVELKGLFCWVFFQKIIKLDLGMRALKKILCGFVFSKFPFSRNILLPVAFCLVLSNDFELTAVF